MLWRYQVMKHTEENGEVWYGVHEFYYGEDAPEMFTTDPITVYGDSVEDIQKQLHMILADLREFPVVDYK